MDTITCCHPANEPRPLLDEKAEYVSDALSWKVRLDLAVGVIDHRNLYRNPGAQV